jgi:hypothetical protein
MSNTQDTVEGSELLPFDSLVNLGNYNYYAAFRETLFTAANMEYPGIVLTPNLGDPIPGEPPDDLKLLFNYRSSFASLDSKYREQVLSKIKNSGLLELIEGVGGMREFSRLRFSSAENLRRIRL